MATHQRKATVAITATLLTVASATAASAAAARERLHTAGAGTQMVGASVLPGGRDSGSAGQDSAAVVAVIDRFHNALRTGDSAQVAALLLPDVVILESGSVETRDEYLGGHLRADIAFAQAVPRERGPIDVRIHGDVAYAASTSTSRGEYRGRRVNAAGAELIVLRRSADGWKIAAIHWSSRSLPS